MYNLSALSLLALSTQLPSILAAPAPISAEMEIRSEEQGLPKDIVQGTIGIKDNGALVDGWNAANNYTGPGSLDVDFCECDDIGPDFQWFITITNDAKYDKGGCGSGLLDNFRGRCGVITNWGCQMVGKDRTTAAIYFASQMGCTLSDGTDVIAQSTQNGIPHMQCQGTNEEGGDVGREGPGATDGGKASGEGDVGVGVE